ncbi:hypothetical protein NC651_024737 [Populus alba x Populus x berolinensis]|nr:hypothetical protein NC651_024737 [Populus alba x Populus x berolinensis]
MVKERSLRSTPQGDREKGKGRDISSFNSKKQGVLGSSDPAIWSVLFLLQLFLRFHRNGLLNVAPRGTHFSWSLFVSLRVVISDF